MTLTFPVEMYTQFLEALRKGRKWYAQPFAVTLQENAFVGTRRVCARDRSHAVYLSVQYYWRRFDGVLGAVGKILTVNDPYREVVYTKDFSCNDRKNNYLPQEVKDRVIRESQGVLRDGGGGGTAHHPARSLRLVARRRKLPFRIQPHLYKDANGTLFYSITVRPQVTYRNGVGHVQKRSVRLVRLETRDTKQALDEVRTRRLLERHLANSLRNVKTRHAQRLSTA